MTQADNARACNDHLWLAFERMQRDLEVTEKEMARIAVEALRRARLLIDAARWKHDPGR